MTKDNDEMLQMLNDSTNSEPKNTAEVDGIVEFATSAGFRELDEMLAAMKEFAEKMDELALSIMFEQPIAELRTRYDALYELLEDDVDPESLHGREKQVYIESQKVRSYLLVELYNKYKQDDNKESYSTVTEEE